MPLLRSLPILIIAFYLCLDTPTPSLAADDPPEDFETRGQILLEHFIEKEKKPNFAAVAARYALGERVNEAHRMLTTLLASPSTEASYMFYLMATYLFGRQNLPVSLAESIQQTLAANAPQRGEAEHEWHMYYAAILLAAETWPEKTPAQWFNGKSSTENLREAMDYFNEWIQQSVRDGQVEYDSPEFMPTFYATLAVLHEFTRDDELRKRLKVMMNLLVIDFAAEHLHGMYAGAHSQSVQQQLLNPRQTLSSGYAWLYFGAGEMTPSAELLFASLSSYQLPDVVLELATGREPLGGYVHHERKRGRSPRRYKLLSDPPVCKYSYITRDYILGSTQGGAFYPHDQNIWNLNYVAKDDRRPVLFIMNPSVTDWELARFSPDPPRVLLDEWKLANHENRLTGASAFESIFQHRNVLIGLYEAPDSSSQTKLHGFFSTDLELEQTLGDSSGEHQPLWMFGRAAETFIAVLPFRPFRFEKFPEGKLLVSEGWRNGYVVEVSTPAESESFDEFKRRVSLVSKIDLHQLESHNKIKYTTSYGDKMEFSFDATLSQPHRSLNGETISASNCALYDSRYLKYYSDNHRLVLRIKNRWLSLDFEKWEVSEKLTSITDELQPESQ